MSDLQAKALAVMGIILGVSVLLFGVNAVSRFGRNVATGGLAKLVGERSAPAGATGPSTGVTYESPIGLSISIDSQRGIILQCSGRIPTLIGTFSVYSDVSFPGKQTLTVNMGDRKHVYDLGGHAFKVDLPNDLQGKSRVEYDGRGNIVVTVPDPIL